MRRTGWVAGVVAAAVLLPAVPAVAEGSFDSSISNAAGGFESRRWADRNADGASTGVYVSACTYNFPGGNRVGIELKRDDSLNPDENYGAKNFPCTSGSGRVFNYWGNKGAGNFYFRIYSINDVTPGNFYRFSAGGAGARY